MHGVAGRGTALEQGVEKCTVLADLARVAGGRHAERKAGERSDQRLDGRIALKRELWVAVALDGPDGEAEQSNKAHQPSDYDEGSAHRWLWLTRSCVLVP